MENSGLNVTDAGTFAAFRGLGGFGGYGYGLPNGNFGGDGSAVKEGVRGNRDISLLESINRSTSDQFLSNKITDGNANLTATITRGDNFLSEQIRERSISDRFNSLERLMFSNQNDTQRDIQAVALKQAECCCELRAGQASILAEIKCNREVSEARQAGLDQAKLDAILAAQK